KEDEIKFIPKRFEKIYFNWMENIQDWCISRQLWWGHRIPAWYCETCGEVSVSNDNLEECSKCHSNNIHQDEDVLDTWFSSALWPFSTLGWPIDTEELKYFYPTDVLVTAYDIIFFWVARMIFSGLHNLNKKPFHTVLINGIIRDSEGKKMSKSLGNGVDPLDTIDEYGADALRFSLLTGVAPGADSRYFPERVEAARNFANKIWNASRFVMMNLDEDILNKYKDCKDYSLADRWILSRCNSLVKEVTENIEKYEIGIALSKVYDFIWTCFCDFYIELSKISLYGNNEKEKGVTLNVLKDVLIKSLQLLHPVMPFITEEIYTHLNAEYESITISKWPEYNKEIDDIKSENKMEYIIEDIKAIRNLRTDMNVPYSKKSNLYICVTDENARAAYENGYNYFTKLAFCSNVYITEEEKKSEEFVSIVTTTSKLFLPLKDLIDRDKEIERLNKERERLKSEIERAESKILNENFINKAPKGLVEEERLKLKKFKEMLDIIISKIDLV
ncbi:MAG: class I tRNA ligase family protein, partial [Oscillospiraceae bacterium]|nr:class I tRNA ligase family protein [Oscillospiraceae bacterium]